MISTHHVLLSKIILPLLTCQGIFYDHDLNRALYNLGFSIWALQSADGLFLSCDYLCLFLFVFVCLFRSDTFEKVIVLFLWFGFVLIYDEVTKLKR